MGTGRYDRILLDEPLRKYLYEHHITPENYRQSEGELRALFPDEAAWEAFERQYLSKVSMISYRGFFREGQHMDLFLHPRYIQQEDHAHDFFEMKYQLVGSGTVYVDGRMAFLRESDICILSPYVPHRNEVYTDDACMINIVLPPEHLKALFPRVLAFENSLRDYFDRSGSGAPPTDGRWLRLETGRHEGVRRVMAAALDYFSREGGRSLLGDRQQENALEQVLLWALEATPNFNRTARTERRGDIVNRIVDHLQRHLEEASLADTAAALHFSPTYISRVVKRQTGYTFQMLLILRMEAVARRLKQTELSVDQIAAEVGLTGKSNFYEKFRAFYGVNPGEYRKRNRAESV